MTELAAQHAELLAFLPEERVGVVQSLEPINRGLSGAGVYAVTTSRGAYVLRVQDRQPSKDYFAQQLRVLRCVAEAEIAPAVVHVDEAARAVVSVRVLGTPTAAVLADPAERPRVLGAVVEQLRRLHALDVSGLSVSAAEPLPHVRKLWQEQRLRPGFPAWASELAPTFAAIERALASDPRRALCHNDINPGNFLWDGQRAWLVDWEATGLGHPYYDLAALALFLRLDEDTAFSLTELHDGAPLSDVGRLSLRALRKLAGMLSGLTFLSLAADLGDDAAPSLAEVPTLSDCYSALRSGQLALQSPAGQIAFGQALLAAGISGPL